MSAVRVEIRKYLILAVPAVSSESRLVTNWMAFGSTNWFSNFVG